MKSKRFLTVALLGVLLLSLSGCIGVNRNFKNVRSHLLTSLEGRYHKEIEFSVGKGLISLGSIFVSFTDAEDHAKKILRKLDRVQIGVYENVGHTNFEFSRDKLLSLCSIMEEQGMHFIVRTRDNNELTAVFLRNDDDDEIRDMYVISFDSNELVIVEVKGDIDDIIEIALKEANNKIEFNTEISMIE